MQQGLWHLVMPTMIELAGMGVCMENGEAHLKAAADFIAPRHDQDGVAIVLEKLLKEF